MIKMFALKTAGMALIIAMCLTYMLILGGCVGSAVNPSPEQIRAREMAPPSTRIHCITHYGPYGYASTRCYQ